MANSNPIQARQAKKSYRKPGDLKALQHKLWGAILHAEEVLESASNDKVHIPVESFNRNMQQYPFQYP